MGFRSLSGAAGGGAFSNFVLSVGQSGNTTYVLDEAYPAGIYTISTLSDATFDIYAIGTDGTQAGYTSGFNLQTSADIKEIVILGAAANEVFTFEYSGAVTTPTSKGDVASAGAFVTSVDPSSLPSVDDTVTVTGGNFAADVEAYFIDQSANEVAAKTVVRNSSTEIVVTRPDSFSTADSPFTIKVVNPNVTLPTGSSAHLLSNAVTAGTNPVWQTTAAQAYNIGIANTITLVASDTEASDVDYAITAGSLPAGLTLDGETGVISGTPSGGAEGDQTVFTVRATDAGGNFVDREFTFTANTAPTWTTTSSDVGAFNVGSPVNFQFVADGGTGGGSLTYSLQSGNLPTGTSLSSTGLLTGTPNTGGTATFTLRVTDEGGLFADREFSVDVEAVTDMLGGVQTQDANYVYHTFLSSGTLTVNSVRTGDTIEALVIAGGGGGGGGNRGGGGGAGGVKVYSIDPSTLSAGQYNVVLGAGGAGKAHGEDPSMEPGDDGSDSSVFAVSTVGGGGGGRGYAQPATSNYGRSGGSGGGGGSNGVTVGGSGTAGQGNDGGGSGGSPYQNPFVAAGGGGATQIGGEAFTASGASSGGGDGLALTDWASATSTGSSSFYAGGGGGGGWDSNYGGGAGSPGGQGGGGRGGGNNPAEAGLANTGGGGGGAHRNNLYDGANGGSGVIVVRYSL